MTIFEQTIKQSELILTEGAIVERLKSEYGVIPDPYINHANLVYMTPTVLGTLYRQYIDIAQKHQLPIMLMTPTRRVNFESAKASGFSDKNIIIDSCKFLNGIKSSYKAFSKNISIGGLLGCKGDAFTGVKVFNIEEAYQFHKIQANEFKNCDVDFLFAGIMPEINEAVGMAKAMSETKIPYIISFMIKDDGCLLDGTSISDAIKIIDEKVSTPPVCYMTNCVHPKNLKLALTNNKNKNRPELKRFKGIQANTSAMSPDELNNCSILQENNFKSMKDDMLFLKKEFSFNIFGGCCGTNDQFIDDLATSLKYNIT